MSKRNNIFSSFGYAGNGIKQAIKTEPNFRIHLIIAFAGIILAFIFQFSLLRWAILILTIAIVMVLELVNTGIEKIVDIIRPNYSPVAKLIKDVSAAAVLLSAFAAIAVGLLLFLPQTLQFLSFLTR